MKLLQVDIKGETVADLGPPVPDDAPTLASRCDLSYATAMSKQPKKGRPTKPASEKRKHCISVWLDSDGKERIQRAAKSAGDASGRWLGKVGDEAARRALAAMGMS